MSDKLKACPFCGEPVDFDRFVFHPYGTCIMAESTYGLTNWNTRPIEDALSARVKVLEDAIRQAKHHGLSINATAILRAALEPKL